MTSLVSFHRFTLIKFCGLVLSNMDLLILSSSFGLGLVRELWGCLKDVVCGKVIKQLFLPFTNNRLTTSLFSTIFFPSALTLLLILSGIFLYVDVVASVVNLLYLSVSIWYNFDVLYAKTKSFLNFFKAWI